MENKTTMIANLKADLEEETQRAVDSFTCKKCGGIIVKSFALSMFCQKRGMDKCCCG